ncbi:hypothetical protein ACWGOQ_0014985 [Aquimarina sp. M1]
MKNLKALFLMMTILFYGFTTTPKESKKNEGSTTNILQESESIEAIFDGLEDGSYDFSFTNEDGDEDVMFFTKITPEALKLYNLKDKSFIGKKFEITFTSEIEIETDEDGDKQEFEIRTITDLKLKN